MYFVFQKPTIKNGGFNKKKVGLLTLIQPIAIVFFFNFSSFCSFSLYFSSFPLLFLLFCHCHFLFLPPFFYVGFLVSFLPFFSWACVLRAPPFFQMSRRQTKWDVIFFFFSEGSIQPSGQVRGPLHSRDSDSTKVDEEKGAPGGSLEERKRYVCTCCSRQSPPKSTGNIIRS